MIEKLQELLIKLKEGAKKIDLEASKKEAEELEALQLAPGFWDNADKAQEISKKIALNKKNIDQWESVLSELEAMIAMWAEMEMTDEANELIKKAEALLKLTYLSGKYDKNNCILSVICGAGGTYAQDFTEMLARMYARYFEKKEYSISVLDQTKAEDAGLKNITFKVEAPYAYGYLRGEHGVHRLVRLSPFNSGNTRETSFAMVDVVPILDAEQEILIDATDLRVDVFRASGAGGQHVNTTDSAVRITHLPTGLVVSSQSERSQHQNKENALKILQGKLAQLMIEQNLAKVDDLRGLKTEMAWGNQIRSYVLHPYKMVKDHRTGCESNSPEAVLDGDLDEFIEAEVGI